MDHSPFIAAVVQASPERDGRPWDTDATVARARELVAEAAARGARLVVFPEAFVGGYPKGEDFGIRLGSRTEAGREAFAEYFARSTEVPGPVTDALGACAREHGVEIVAGVIERGGSTLYCTAVFIGEDGGLRAKHRKLVPTGLERCVWGRGDGSTLSVVDTEHGKIGAAICWENYMPLFRTSLYAKGVELYAAPTVDDRDVWQSTMRHIAVEGRCFVLSACQYRPAIDGVERSEIRGGSVIVDPFGEVLAGPVYDEETILIATLDMGAIPRAKLDLDVVGHYARPDVFELRVDEGAGAADPWTLRVLDGTFDIHRLPADAPMPTNVSPTWIARTEDELSLVVPAGTDVGAGEVSAAWRALQVVGPIPHDVVGLLARLTEALAAARIPVFAQSTFDTDYLLVPKAELERAIRALADAGFVVDQRRS